MLAEATAGADELEAGEKVAPFVPLAAFSLSISFDMKLLPPPLDWPVHITR
jgi:hypothetical protein